MLTNDELDELFTLVRAVREKLHELEEWLSNQSERKRNGYRDVYEVMADEEGKAYDFDD